MAAPIGNKFAVGNSGRPPVYGTVRELEAEITAYFDDCVENGTKLTVTGLALYLGFSSRSSLDDYQGKGEEYSYLIKRARMVIEQAYEENLQGNCPAGSIFALKNMGWRDKVETGFTDTHGNDAPVQIIQLPANNRNIGPQEEK